MIEDLNCKLDGFADSTKYKCRCYNEILKFSKRLHIIEPCKKCVEEGYKEFVNMNIEM